MSASPSPTRSDAPPPSANSTGCRVLAALLLLALVGVPALFVFGGAWAAVQRRNRLRNARGFTPPVAKDEPADVLLCRTQLAQLKASLMEYQNDEVFFPRNRAPREDVDALFRNDVGFAYAGLMNERSAGGGKNAPYLKWPREQIGRASGSTVFLDPWGSPLVYREWAHVDDVQKSKAHLSRRLADGKVVHDVPHDDLQFDLYSFGPNRQDEFGAGDDVTSWPK